MNIFVTDECPITSARALDNKRVVKMILESAQLISTHMNLNGKKGPYKSTHVNHPVSRWIGKETGNLNWLLNHFIALCKEYTYRYGKVHKCELFLPIFKQYIRQFDCPRPLSPFVNCTNFKNYDTIEAYRLALIDKWKNDKYKPSWGERCKPRWFKGGTK